MRPEQHSYRSTPEDLTTARRWLFAAMGFYAGFLLIAVVAMAMYLPAPSGVENAQLGVTSEMPWLEVPGHHRKAELP
jgi:hypothetical protein